MQRNANLSQKPLPQIQEAQSVAMELVLRSAKYRQSHLQGIYIPCRLYRYHPPLHLDRRGTRYVISGRPYFAEFTCHL